MPNSATDEPIHNSDLIATLRFSQQSPMILGQQTTSGISPLTGPVRNRPEDYGLMEQLFFSCLQTGDDKSAAMCLERLIQFFGPSNEKVMGLRGLYQEAIAVDRPALEKSLHEYDTVLSQNPANLSRAPRLTRFYLQPVLKRQVALLRSVSRPADAIAGLVKLLEATPTDAEAWCELADLYQSQGMSSQAIFCLEEALLIAPNAWNVHACLAELLYVCVSSQHAEDSLSFLERSTRHYCRSIELCNDYLRGFYGLALVTSLLLKSQYSNGTSEDRAESASLKNNTLLRLNTFARQKLGDIVRQRLAGHESSGCSQSELIAVKELLNSQSGKSE